MLAAMLLAFAVGAAPAEPTLAPAKKAAVKVCTAKKADCKACAKACKGLPADVRKMSDSENCPFVLWIGSKRLIKRRKLDEYIDRMYSI
jgi:hypothetical protein